MSFARAFSTATRREKPPAVEPIYVGRAATQRNGRPVHRTQISSPTALISTSNVHVYTAQRIAGATPIEIRKVSHSSSDSSASDESDNCFSLRSAGTITDASSIDESPTSTSPETNYLTSYLKAGAAKGTRERSATESSADSYDPDVTPRIPQRAPSHSKKAHQELHHKKSLQRIQTPPVVISDAPRSSFDIVAERSSAKQPQTKALLPPLSFQTSSYEHGRTSFDVPDFRPKIAPVKSPLTKSAPISAVHSPVSPFDKELAQLEEVANDFGNAVRTADEDADVMYMEKHGLATFSATDYMSEIQSLIHAMFAEEQPLFMSLGGFF